MFNLKLTIMAVMSAFVSFQEVVHNDEMLLLRKNFEKNKDNYEACIESYKKLKNNDNPVYQGYCAMYAFMLAKHSFDPFSKWHYFIEGKRILEKAISSHPENVELRFLRLVIQTNLPKVLNYDSDIEKDKKFIQMCIKENKIQYLDLLNRIQEFLSNH